MNVKMKDPLTLFSERLPLNIKQDIKLDLQKSEQREIFFSNLKTIDQKHGNPISNFQKPQKNFIFNPLKHIEYKEPVSVLAMFIDHEKKRDRRRSENLMSPKISRGSYSLTTKPQTVFAIKQKKRQERLIRNCEDTRDEYYHYPIDTLSKYRNILKNILVDDDHKLLYCYVPKVS